MGIDINVQTGPQNIGRTGASGELRGGNTGEAIVSKYLPDYAQAALDGVTFSANNQSAQAISVALATTYTGLALYNPPGSGVIVLPKFVKFALSVAPAAIAPIGLIGAPVPQASNLTETAAVTVQSTQIGNGARGRARVLSQATIPTPTWLMMLYDGFTAAALPAPQVPVDLRGTFALQPGSVIAIGALTAVTGFGTWIWDEVPLAS